MKKTDTEADKIWNQLVRKYPNLSNDELNAMLAEKLEKISDMKEKRFKG